jgi:DNA-binding CsgD family transcriptional regulator
MGNREDVPPRHGEGQAPISSSGDPVSNDEVTRMEHRRNDAREKIAGGDRNQGSEDRLEIGSHDPRRGEEDGRPNVARASPTARGLVPKRGAASSWVSWQSGLYLLVLGVVCLVLVPLTSFWWIVPILGAVVPLALAFLERPDLELGKPDDKKHKEGELLEALAEWGEITPTTAAMRTSLTVDEASKMLDGLAGKGHLELQAEDGIMAYALRECDRPRAPEVLALLASGRTNAEIAKDLFVAVGTVKSHVNNIYRKLGAANRAGAVTRARDLKLLR